MNTAALNCILCSNRLLCLHVILSVRVSGSCFSSPIILVKSIFQADTNILQVLLHHHKLPFSESSLWTLSNGYYLLYSDQQILYPIISHVPALLVDTPSGLLWWRLPISWFIPFPYIAYQLSSYLVFTWAFSFLQCEVVVFPSSSLASILTHMSWLD